MASVVAWAFSFCRLSSLIRLAKAADNRIISNAEPRRMLLLEGGEPGHWPVDRRTLDKHAEIRAQTKPLKISSPCPTANGCPPATTPRPGSHRESLRKAKAERTHPGGKSSRGHRRPQSTQWRAGPCLPTAAFRACTGRWRVNRAAKHVATAVARVHGSGHSTKLTPPRRTALPGLTVRRCRHPGMR